MVTCYIYQKIYQSSMKTTMKEVYEHFGIHHGCLYFLRSRRRRLAGPLRINYCFVRAKIDRETSTGHWSQLPVPLDNVSEGKNDLYKTKTE